MRTMLMGKVKLLDPEDPHPAAGKMKASRRTHGAHSGYDDIKSFQWLTLDIIQGRKFPPPGNQVGIVQFMTKHRLGIASFRLNYTMVVNDP